MTETRSEQPAADQEATPPAPLGPTPLLDVKIFQKLLTDDDPKPWLHVAGWMDFDYTYRSTGSGENNVAPVMNRFGDEFLTRQLGLYLFKPLDEKCWSWGFNAIFIGGADASFLTPTAGGWNNTNPRFGADFTDLNVTAPHADPHGRRRGRQGRPADDRPRPDGRPAVAAHLRFQRLRLVQHGRRPLYRRLRRLARQQAAGLVQRLRGGLGHLLRRQHHRHRLHHPADLLARPGGQEDQGVDDGLDRPDLAVQRRQHHGP